MHFWSLLSIYMAKFVAPMGVLLVAAMAYWSVRRRREDQQRAVHAFKATVANDLIEPTTLHPEIDAARCTGCTACVRACPEGDILQIINHRAVLVKPNMCVGHGQCEIACPFGAIDLVFGTKRRGMELPRITTNYETNVKGLYIAGELGGMGLIRNAVRQGKMSVMHAMSTMSPNVPADLDLLIVGAGSAGLSAALAAAQGRINYVCIEQNSLGGTIYNFPRQKIVMTQPAELPMVGAMEFPGNKVSKEELLSYWNKIRKKYRLKIREGCKFINLSKNNEVFTVETSLGVITAKKVILAMGVRGTARKINVPGEELPKVTYNLLEPEQYRRREIAIVGGGNAAIEAALQLANPTLKNRVTLLVRSKSFNRANQENIDAVNRLALQEKIWILFESSIASIHPGHVMIDYGGSSMKLNNSYVFIFAGAEIPATFLKGLGIKIDKKFGERLRRK